MNRKAGNSLQKRFFSNREDLWTELVQVAQQQIELAVQESGRASLVLSGGSTPAPLYKRLATLDLPWTHLYCTLSDERWVPESDPDSNQAMIQKTLFAAGHDALFQPLFVPGLKPVQAEAPLHLNLEAWPRPFDWVLLGMGEDGHTASFFPGAPELAQALDLHSDRLCRAIHPPESKIARMTLTRTALLNSRSIALLVLGDAKREVLERAVQPGPITALPVRSILFQDHAPVTVYWAP